MKTKNPIVRFLDCDCEVVKHQYNNGRTALELIIAENDETRELYKGEPMATATVNMPSFNLESDEVVIKNYSENEGMLETLIVAGIVTPTGKSISNGFVSCPVCKLLI